MENYYYMPCSFAKTSTEDVKKTNHIFREKKKRYFLDNIELLGVKELLYDGKYCGIGDKYLIKVTLEVEVPANT